MLGGTVLSLLWLLILWLLCLWLFKSYLYDTHSIAICLVLLFFFFLTCETFIFFFFSCDNVFFFDGPEQATPNMPQWWFQRRRRVPMWCFIVFLFFTYQLKTFLKILTLHHAASRKTFFSSGFQKHSSYKIKICFRGKLPNTASNAEWQYQSFEMINHSHSYWTCYCTSIVSEILVFGATGCNL